MGISCVKLPIWKGCGLTKLQSYTFDLPDGKRDFSSLRKAESMWGYLFSLPDRSGGCSFTRISSTQTNVRKEIPLFRRVTQKNMTATK